MAETENPTPQIHNVSVVKLEDDKYRILFGTKTEIPDLYSASTGIELNRGLLEQFVKNAQEVLAK